jgi:hypothetical protein
MAGSVRWHRSICESRNVSLSSFQKPPVGPSQLDRELVDRARSEVAAVQRVPTIEEVRSILSKIPGSLADDVCVEREDR